MRRAAWFLAAGLVACAAPSEEPGPDAGAPDAGVVEKTWTIDPAASPDKHAGCVGTFGNALTNSFGRLDGTVIAVVRPVDATCPLPNNDHVIVEVSAGGAAYRMVVNVESTVGDPEVRLALPVLDGLPGGPWADGWHAAQTLDYVQDFGLHAADFTPHPLAELSDLVGKALTVGAKVSVFATSSGGTRADSAHLVHRNGSGHDGAIVIDPEAARPRAMAFAFADQAF